MITAAQRLRGGAWGLLVGDALGVPYEFHGPGDIPPLDQIEMQPPAGYQRAHAMVAPGTWSDDGAQALCLAEALSGCGDAPFYDRLAGNLVRWRNEGFMAVGRSVFDIGGATSSAINRLQVRRDDGRSCGLVEEHALGNGALMRVLPLALWQNDEATLIEHAMQQSRLTHAHPVSQLACALYCVWVQGLMRDDTAAWEAARSAVDAHVESDQRQAWNRLLNDLDEAPGGSGYVVDCLRSARWAVEAHGNYESVVRAAIALGHDTDTTACVAGGAAGVRFGIAGIPARWLKQMRGRELAEPLIQAIVAHGAAQ